MKKIFISISSILLITSCSDVKQEHKEEVREEEMQSVKEDVNMHPLTMPINTKEEFQKYASSRASENIKFNLEDYVGTWYDPRGRDFDFIFRSDLSLELDWRKGSCKIVEQTNNTLMLECYGDWGKNTKTGPQYVRLQLFYFSYTRNEARLTMQITFNQNIDCARAGSAGGITDPKEPPRDVCFPHHTKWTAENRNFKMYQKR